MIKISVILTVYNRTEFLHQSIESIINQTYTNFELIIADDSNLFEIAEICKSFDNSKIIYEGNKENLGVFENLKNAISISHGDYISILNDDDYRDSMFLEKLVKILESNNTIDIIFSEHWLVDKKGKILESLTEETCSKHGRKNLNDGIVEDVKNLVIEYNGIPLAMSSIVKKKSLELNKINIEVSGSYDLWISYLLANQNAIAWFVSERLSYYRVHEKMETQRKAFDKNIHKINIVNEALKMFPEYKNLFLKRKSYLYYLVGKDHLLFGKNKEAFYYFKNSIFINFKAKPILALIFSSFPSMITLFFIKILVKQNY